MIPGPLESNPLPMIRQFVLTTLSLMPLLAAQNDGSKPTSQPSKPATEVKASAPKQDPVKPVQPPQAQPAPITPEQRVARLRAELEQMQRELAAVKSLNDHGGVNNTVRAEITSRDIVVPVAVALDTGDTPTMANLRGPGPKVALDNSRLQPSRRKVRLFAPSDAERFPEGTMCSVDGMPIGREDFNDHVRFLRTFLVDEDAEGLRQRALRDLLIVRVAEVTYGEEIAAAARQRGKRFKELMDLKTPISELSRRKVSDATEPQGDLGMISRDYKLPVLAEVAFSLAPGQTSSVFQTREGFHVIRVIEKSEDGEQVHVEHARAAYDPKLGKAMEILARLQGGFCDIAFAQRDDMALAPAVYQH